MTERGLGPTGSPRRRRLWHVFEVLALAWIAGGLGVVGVVFVGIGFLAPPAVRLF